jgi:membrane-bound lytic murein transglycosylase F
LRLAAIGQQHLESGSQRGKRPLVLALLVIALIITIIASINFRPPLPMSLAAIQKGGKITLITRNNAHCYYTYRNQAMGFEYDLAKAFATDLGLDLEVKVIEQWEEMVAALLNQKGNFIAANLAIEPHRQKEIAFSNGYLDVQPVMVTHRINRTIQMPFDLEGKTVHVRTGSSYLKHLLDLKQNGVALKLSLYDDIATEELIRQVAGRKVEVTIAYSNIALLNRRYYPQTMLAGPLDFPKKMGWAVDPRATRLLERINQFLAEIKKNGQFTEIYKRYYTGVEEFDYVNMKRFHRRIKTRLPNFLNHINKAATKYKFDWRLIAAQMYQESHFRPKAKSRRGAYGLMQLTKNTAKSLGVTNLFEPAANIFAGVRYLRRLYNIYDQATPTDRLFFALAAYNVGQGHILDARRLAEKKGLDPDRWASLEKTLPLLRYPKYYRKSIYGYCRGTEPIRYIKQIMGYYDILKRQAIDYGSDQPG